MHRKNLTVTATLALVLMGASAASATDCTPTPAVFEQQIVSPAIPEIPGVPAVTEVQARWSLSPLLEGWEPTGETRKVVTTEAVPGAPAVAAVTHQEYIFERTVTVPSKSYDVGGYTVSSDGVTLNEGVFKKHGHVNWKVTGVDGKIRPGGIHFDPNNGHPGGAYIGKNFVPITLAPGECITWVQVAGFNAHLGEGKHKVKVCAPSSTTERTDWVREAPGEGWSQVEERTVTDVAAIPALPAVDEVSYLEHEHQRTVELTPAVPAVPAVDAIINEVLVTPAKTCPAEPEEPSSPTTPSTPSEQPSSPSSPPPAASSPLSPSSATPKTATPTTSPAPAATSVATPKTSTPSARVLATTGTGSWVALVSMASALMAGGALLLLVRRNRRRQQ